jgi:hypothetical protein
MLLGRARQSFFLQWQSDRFHCRCLFDDPRVLNTLTNPISPPFHDFCSLLQCRLQLSSREPGFLRCLRHIGRHTFGAFPNASIAPAMQSAFQILRREDDSHRELPQHQPEHVMDGRDGEPPMSHSSRRDYSPGAPPDHWKSRAFTAKGRN